MSKIFCEVEYSTDENDEGVEVDCVIVTCSKCGHQVQSWGDSDQSIKRSCAVMSEECPESESNFYEAE